MALTVHYGPQDRNPDFFRGDMQYAKFVASGGSGGTEVMVAAGGGVLNSVEIGVAVASSTVEFFDTPSGGTADATTSIAKVSMAATADAIRPRLTFSKGLTAIVTTGGASEFTVAFSGRAFVNSHTFGAH